MAQVFGRKSKYLIGFDWINRIAAILTLIVLIFLVYSYFRINVFGKSGSLLGVVIIAAVYASIFLLAKRRGEKYLSDSGDFKRGRTAEYEICEYLQQLLPNEYFIFRNIRLGKFSGDIDLIILGPTGILAIDVKSHCGEITFDGENLLGNGREFEKNILGQILKNVYDLRDFLKLKTGKEYFINPAIVFPSDGATMHFGLNSVYKNVRVVRKGFLRDLVLKNSNHIAENDIIKIRNILETAVS
jgi:hypothetical protein